MLIVIAIFVILALGIPRLVTEGFAINRIYQVDNSPIRSIGIVFGAGLYRDGSPTPVLRHRVATAVDLYKTGKILKILMSGDNRFEDYNEPAAMLSYAVQLGVPAEDIVLDYAGRRTYDTCYRAKHIFGVDEAVLITQRFHLSRAIFTCNMIGLEAIGVNANRVRYRTVSRVIWNAREFPATMVALWELLITKPTPILGEPEPIIVKSVDKPADQ